MGDWLASEGRAAWAPSSRAPCRPSCAGPVLAAPPRAGTAAARGGTVAGGQAAPCGLPACRGPGVPPAPATAARCSPQRVTGIAPVRTKGRAPAAPGQAVPYEPSPGGEDLPLFSRLSPRLPSACGERGASGGRGLGLPPAAGLCTAARPAEPAPGEGGGGRKGCAAVTVKLSPLRSCRNPWATQPARFRRHPLGNAGGGGRGEPGPLMGGAGAVLLPPPRHSGTGGARPVRPAAPAEREPSPPRARPVAGLPGGACTR